MPSSCNVFFFSSLAIVVWSERNQLEEKINLWPSCARTSWIRVSIWMTMGRFADGKGISSTKREAAQSGISSQLIDTVDLSMRRNEMMRRREKRKREGKGIGREVTNDNRERWMWSNCSFFSAVSQGSMWYFFPCWRATNVRLFQSSKRGMKALNHSKEIPLQSTRHNGKKWVKLDTRNDERTDRLKETISRGKDRQKTRSESASISVCTCNWNQMLIGRRK